jgi:hypothetical protein
MVLGTHFPGTDWHYWTSCTDTELATALAVIAKD